LNSGLDIPTANHNDRATVADMFDWRSVSDQGQVGRSKTRAYAYLTTKNPAPS